MTDGSRALVLLFLLAGCQGTSQVFDNPVVGPPPPRVGQAEDKGEVGAARVELTDFTPPAEETIQPGDVAARVNGTPIFVSEVLQPYAPQLAKFRSQVSAVEFARMQKNLVQRDLPHYIETAVLVDVVQAQMNDEQKTAVNKQLDTIFEAQLAEMMQAANVQSVAELEIKLKAAGTSLANEMQVTGESLGDIRKSFGNKALSGQYLRETVGTIATPTRKELLAEYESRLKDYSQPARVKWQQLQISFDVHNGQDNARLAMARARADLQAGMSFDEVVKKHGDGAMSKLGGQFDWTEPAGVANPALRDALTTLKNGEVSGPIEGEKAWMLVKITEEQAARTTPFDDVQPELRAAITKRKRDERVAHVIAEVRAKAVVETMFDDEPDADRQDSPKHASNPPSS